MGRSQRYSGWWTVFKNLLEAFMFVLACVLIAGAVMLVAWTIYGDRVQGQHLLYCLQDDCRFIPAGESPPPTWPPPTPAVESPPPTPAVECLPDTRPEKVDVDYRRMPDGTNPVWMKPLPPEGKHCEVLEKGEGYEIHCHYATFYAVDGWTSRGTDRPGRIVSKGTASKEKRKLGCWKVP